MFNSVWLDLKGTAHDVIKTLPRPHEQVEKKRRTRSSRAIGGSGSGSLKQLLLQMNQEEKFKNTIENVCEKNNTLRLSQKSTMNDEAFDTFVYKCDSDSEEELESAGTILDNSLLKQYTEQLDTFVFKGEGILDSDSDYSTGGSVKNKGSKEYIKDEDDVSRTLLKQYSQTLEEDDDVEAEVEKVYEGKGNGQVEDDDSGWGHSNSPATSTNFAETFVSKYQYKGLKDTLAIRPDKRWSKYQSDSRDVFSPNRVVEEKVQRKMFKNMKVILSEISGYTKRNFVVGMAMCYSSLKIINFI